MDRIRVWLAMLVLATAGTMAAPVAGQERITIASAWGTVTAVLADNAAARALGGMLPVAIEMRDHLRQEKTGFLPAGLPEVARQRGFEKGTLGIWNQNHFVIYYRDGQVPMPGIMIVGRVDGDASIFDREGSVTVRLERAR